MYDAQGVPVPWTGTTRFELVLPPDSFKENGSNYVWVRPERKLNIRRVHVHLTFCLSTGRPSESTKSDRKFLSDNNERKTSTRLLPNAVFFVSQLTLPTILFLPPLSNIVLPSSGPMTMMDQFHILPANLMMNHLLPQTQASRITRMSNFVIHATNLPGFTNIVAVNGRLYVNKCFACSSRTARSTLGCETLFLQCLFRLFLRLLNHHRMMRATMTMTSPIPPTLSANSVLRNFNASRLFNE